METAQIKKQRMVFGAFYGDAFALGPHWIYDVKEIEAQFGIIKSLTTPPPKTYHAGKTKGDFTHYGDQALVLLKSIHEHNAFNLQGYKQKWSEFFTSYTGYFDGATKKALANIEEGKSDPVGSASKDLAGANRIAPLIYCYTEQEQLLKAVKEQVAMTHNNEITINTALFFATLTLSILGGEGIERALSTCLGKLKDGHLKSLIEQGFQAAGQDSGVALQKFGTACAVEQSLPGVIQILLTHGDDFQGAMTANVMAGGDSAARGALVGMVLAAAGSVDDSLFLEMTAYQDIKTMLEQIQQHV